MKILKGAGFLLLLSLSLLSACKKEGSDLLYAYGTVQEIYNRFNFTILTDDGITLKSSGGTRAMESPVGERISAAYLKNGESSPTVWNVTVENYTVIETKETILRSELQETAPTPEAVDELLGKQGINIYSAWISPTGYLTLDHSFGFRNPDPAIVRVLSLVADDQQSDAGHLRLEVRFKSPETDYLDAARNAVSFDLRPLLEKMNDSFRVTITYRSLRDGETPAELFFEYRK